jgi:hypothetical protein
MSGNWWLALWWSSIVVVIFLWLRIKAIEDKNKIIEAKISSYKTNLASLCEELRVKKRQLSKNSCLPDDKYHDNSRPS